MQEHNHMYMCMDVSVWVFISYDVHILKSRIHTRVKEAELIITQTLYKSLNHIFVNLLIYLFLFFQSTSIANVD